MEKMPEGQGVFVLGGGFPQSACFHELSSSLNPHEACLLQFVLDTLFLTVTAPTHGLIQVGEGVRG